jgi:hypothetical protein
VGTACGHLLDAVEVEEAVALESSAYGTKYAVRCTLSGQPGLQADVDSIWIVGPDGLPRFITAYPAG